MERVWRRRLGKARGRGGRGAADLKQHWEWLHVQAASLGGVTDASNLVAGSFVVNSAMTPWEAKLRKWRDKTGAGTFDVSFTPTGVSTGPLAAGVDIHVRAHNHPSLQDTIGARIVSFEPITGRVVDRMSYSIEKKESLHTARRPHSTRPAYDVGLADAKSRQPLGPSKSEWAARTDYDNGTRLAAEGAPRPAERGVQAGHDDYKQGIADARARAAPASHGATLGETDYLAGIAAARTAGAPSTAGARAGHADYLQGVADGQAGRARTTRGADDGCADYLQGIADEQASAPPATHGAAWGRRDYLQGLDDARNAVAATTRGATTGRFDYLAGAAEWSRGNPEPVGPSGAVTGYREAASRHIKRKPDDGPVTDRSVKPKGGVG